MFLKIFILKFYNIIYLLKTKIEKKIYQIVHQFLLYYIIVYRKRCLFIFSWKSNIDIELKLK